MIPHPTKKQLKKGVAIIECVQKIPCNPCVSVCPTQSITMKDINDTPHINYETCTGCGLCVGICPGLAIFLVKIVDGTAHVTLPYEFLPIPKTGELVKVVNREGEVIGTGTILRTRTTKNTTIVTVEVPEKLAMDVRHIKVKA